ncbi:MAG: class B sortase [Lachnospiraceae bacterium]|nr:class B sortase [Lachnospiraceae bacterium]
MYEVNGRKYRSEDDYKREIHDEKIIDDLKRIYDIDTFEGVKGIYRELQTVSFESDKGRKFDDHVFELYNKYKKGELSDNLSREGVNKKGRSADKKNKGSVKQTKSKPEVMDESMKNAINREIKKQNRKRTLLVISLVVVSFGCIGYFVKYMLDARAAEESAQAMADLRDSSAADFITVSQVLKKEYDDEVVIPEILDEYKVMYQKNKSLIGWVKIDGTKIDYPVMQTYDNEYYLKHNFEQKEDVNGCIFLDCNCDIVLGNTNYIIYGHHMNSGKMFGSLVKYGNEDFYKEHKYIQFDTIYEKGTYEVMYAFRTHIYNADEITFKYYQFIDANSEAEFNSAMEEMSKMSIYDTGVTAVYGDRLITLSTCDYQEENGRFAVVAKKID